MMDGKQKLYFLLNRIEDARVIALAGQPLKIHASHDLNGRYRGTELDQLFTKLEKDEKIIRIIKTGNRVKEIGSRYGLNEPDDGSYHIELLATFEDYYLRIQNEPEYQEFTGKKPSKYKLPITTPANIVKLQKAKINQEIKTNQQKITTTTESKHNTKLWIQNLEAIYQQALNAKPVKPFFLAVYDYVDYVLKTDTLAQLSDVFFVYKKTDYEATEQFKKELIDYIETLIPKLREYKTENPAEKEDIKEILSIRAGTTQVMGDPDGWLSIFGHMESMSWDAFKDGKVNEPVLKLLKIEANDGKKVTKWKALDIRDSYKQETEKLERLRETRGWFAWEHLRLFYEMFNDYESIRQDFVNRQRWFENINFSYLIEELKAVLKNTSYDRMRVFLYDNYITYLQKAHRQLVNEIAQFEEISKSTVPEIKDKKATETIQYDFSDETASLNIKGRTVRFKKDTRKLTLLKLLMRKNKGIYYDEAIEELEGAVIDENIDNKNVYYEVCRGIQMSLAKIGVTDFIQYDYNQAKINPIYKRASR